MALSMRAICTSTTSSVTVTVDSSGQETETSWAASRKARSGSLKEAELCVSGCLGEVAVLGDGRGGYNEHASIELDEKISNEDGQLVYLG